MLFGIDNTCQRHIGLVLFGYTVATLTFRSRGGGFSYEYHRNHQGRRGAHWLRVSMLARTRHAWWATTLHLNFWPLPYAWDAEYRLPQFVRRWLGRLLPAQANQAHDNVRWFVERHWRGSNQNDHLRLWLTWQMWAARRLAWRLRALGWRMHRLALLATPWPVYVGYSGQCCDTGAITWSSHYRTGWAAWRATTDDALHYASDGPTTYRRLRRSEYYRRWHNSVEWMTPWNEERHHA